MGRENLDATIPGRNKHVRVSVFAVPSLGLILTWAEAQGLRTPDLVGIGAIHKKQGGKHA